MKVPFEAWNNPPSHFNFTLDVFERWGKETPDAFALWWMDEAEKEVQKFTFRQLIGKVYQAVTFFEKLGIQRGDRVLIILPRIPEWWISILALVRMGAIVIPGTSLLTTKDIRLRIEHAEVKAMITDSDGAAKAESISIPIRILVGGKYTGWTDWNIQSQNPSSCKFEPTRSDEPSMIFFTSGTTGHPKMVLHTHASVGLAHRVTGELWLDLKKEDVFWNLSDTGWAKAAWSSLYGPWHMGACVFAVDARGKFDPFAVLRILQKYPITVWCAAPTALRLMVREDLSKWSFPKLRHCVSAGEPLNPEVLEIWKKGTGLDIYEGYGQTETVVLAGNFRSHHCSIRPGSMGKCTPGFELAALDLNTMQKLPPGQEGELAIRVDSERPLGLLREYWKNPEENASRFRGGWYFTGDIAKCDEEGYFWFVGRADDVINSSSYRIGPFEVESVLIEHPAVLESAVVAKPDKMRGTIVKAYVVLRKSFTPSEALVRELQEHCKTATAPYKYPREIEFVLDLPKTISGKIRRIELRQRAEAEAAKQNS